MHEITLKHDLLDENGFLIEPGYTKGLLMDYDKNKIKAGKLRIKEWDYYLITCNTFAIALTVDDNYYMGLDSISLIDFNLKWEHTESPMKFMTKGKKNLPSTSESGNTKGDGKGYSIEFINNNDHRILKFHMDNFYQGKSITGEIRLENPNQDSMVIVTPFKENKKAFYYNQKIIGMPASGIVKYGDRTYTFYEGESFGLLDWGRGVWTYKNTWYWGAAHGNINNHIVGWNIGYGFGDTSAASENMIFYDGKAHKLSQITFNIPQNEKGKYLYTDPWTFTSDDKRFEMKFSPIIDRKSCTDVLLIKSDQHQVFGLFNGRIVLDDGTTIEVKDFLGFAERVENKW